MKRNLIGAIVLIATLAFTGCNNDKNKENEEINGEAKAAAKTEEVKLPNRMLIIVDPQNDFTTGSLATKNGPAAMEYLAKALDEGAWKNYSWIIVTQDAHPANHCSFVEQGGVFPPHCVRNTEGMNVYEVLLKSLDGIMGNGSGMQVHFMEKGDLADKEEFSIFQNEHSGAKLRKTIEELGFEGIDICGIATDYCVYETTKDLMEFYPAKQIRIVTNCLAAVDDNDTKLADLMKENGIEGIEF